MKAVDKKYLYLILILFTVVIFLNLEAATVSAADCQPVKLNYIFTYQRCPGNPTRYCMDAGCKSTTKLPVKPGDRGSCLDGQVCNFMCRCEWIDEDADGFITKNMWFTKYTNIDCDDQDSNTNSNSTEMCDHKDNDCDGQVDEGGVCEKNVYFCESNAFTNETKCSGGEWCSTLTTSSSAACNYTTQNEDVGEQKAYVFVCDNFFGDGDFGCYKFIEGPFEVLAPGCPTGTRLCADGTCKSNCPVETPCNSNGACETNESCACDDCFNVQDSCRDGNVCDATTKLCKCSSGLVSCPDGACRVDCGVDTHAECRNSACVQVDGAGSDLCSIDDDCVSSHSECQSNMCVGVPGEGVSECLPLGASCNIPAQNHAECVDGMCVLVSGSGSDQCTENSQCSGPDSHTECNGGSCVEVDGAGVSECLPVGSSCSIPPQKYAGCLFDMCVLLNGTGADSCSGNEDCSVSDYHTECNTYGVCVSVPGAGVSECLPVGDICIPITQKHAECVDGMCVDVAGAGSDQCTGNSQCNGEISHTECNGNTCEEVAGEGISECLPVGGECNIPAQKHADCVGQMCVWLYGLGTDMCADNTECGLHTHTECRSNTCVEVSGDGASQCLPLGDTCNLPPQHHSECIDGVCAEVAGSGTNECTKNEQCTGPVKHTECNGNMCEEVDGPGAFECLPVGSSCSIPPQKHNDCVYDMCVLLFGAGTDECEDSGNCGSETHTECILGQCEQVSGPGASQCLPVGSNCVIPQQNHSDCVDGMCVVLAGAGTNTCTSNTQCNEPASHTECIGNMCTEVDGAGASQCLPVNYACTPSPLNHSDCVYDMCVVLAGAGTDECEGNSECGTTHMACSDHECIEIPGSGVDQCVIKESCSNGIDDDCDADVDCQDDDCSSANICKPPCQPTCPVAICHARTETCDDGFDDDCDSLTDCDDSDCTSNSACINCNPVCEASVCKPTTEICGNGLDDDCDLFTDCNDIMDCAGTNHCIECITTCSPWGVFGNCTKATDNITRVCNDGCGMEFNETKPCINDCVDADHDNNCACQGQALSCDCDDSDPAVNPDVSELCNFKDDNCDATIDDGCPCIEGDNRTCGINQGLCREGKQSCVAGFWSLCGGAYIGPKPEVCDNGIDENCDSYPDDGCVCEDNATQECGTDTGECVIGTQICFSSNWSACSGSADPLSETCSGDKDEDCDGTTDCDDESCDDSTSCDGDDGNNGQRPSCFDGKKNQDEEGIDCGGSCPSCEVTCGGGSISTACSCEGTTRTSGYCCNGKYSFESCSSEVCADSDSDTLCDEDEIRDGTDPNNPDTDGDGIPDGDDTLPLCNIDGACDTERSTYPESAENCPDDCGGAGLGLLWWIIIILIVLIVGSLVFYLLVKKGVIKLGKKKKEEPKLVLGKPLFRPTIQPITQPKKVRDIAKLVSYLESSLKAGDSRLKLREGALKVGWGSDEINRAFDEIDKKKKDTNKGFFDVIKRGGPVKAGPKAAQPKTAVRTISAKPVVKK